MKKLNLTKTAFLITALTIFGNQNSFAKATNNYRVAPIVKPVKDTPYVAKVTIIRTGAIDTPYLQMNLPSENIYKQIVSLLFKQEGLFKVHIIFENEKGEFIREEEYELDYR